MAIIGSGDMAGKDAILEVLKKKGLSDVIVVTPDEAKEHVEKQDGLLPEINSIKSLTAIPEIIPKEYWTPPPDRAVRRKIDRKKNKKHRK